MDNGPECSGRRSQFLSRMVEFTDITRRVVRLAYYPPYHSKYNAIERYWAGMEKSWNGYLLNSVSAVLNRSANFCWKGLSAKVRLFNTVYKKVVKVCGKEREKIEGRLYRSPHLPWWELLFILNRYNCNF